ncbi:MAG TPA: hypothetical protein VNX18_06730 [Bryobacteraceae bacterium]|jgi:hypothetical protein|nr:hypothetical protein [Bryobacteraceae bacterium]
MPRYAFRYQEFMLEPCDAFPQGRVAKRPLLSVTLVAPDGRTFDTVACPDSGADHCVFPLKFAGELGLDVASMKSALSTGVGNAENETWYANITIKMDRGLEFEAYAGFTDGLDDVGYGLLGQEGFFNKYVVLFDHGDGEFCLYTKTL